MTWAEYKLFMQLCSVFEQFEDQGIRPVNKDNEIDAITAPSKLYDPSFTYQSGEDPQKPAVSMSQYAAKQYTKWLSLLTGQFYRLPTESEWEYAFRAATRPDYYFGDDSVDLEQYAWFDENADYETHPVGQKPQCLGTLRRLAMPRSGFWMNIVRTGTASIKARVHGRRNALLAEKLYPRVLRGGSSTPERRTAAVHFVGPATTRICGATIPIRPRARGGSPATKRLILVFELFGRSVVFLEKSRKSTGKLMYGRSPVTPSSESSKKAGGNAGLSIPNSRRRSTTCSRMRRVNQTLHEIRSCNLSG